MDKIALQVKAAKANIARAEQEVRTQGVVIDKLQKICNHVFRFHSQTNACHERLWNVVYKCRECEFTAVSKEPPVCDTCLATLVRAKKSDRQAERERSKSKYQGRLNPPIAFRCPKSRKIHILWHEGD